MQPKKAVAILRTFLQWQVAIAEKGDLMKHLLGMALVAVALTLTGSQFEEVPTGFDNKSNPHRR